MRKQRGFSLIELLIVVAIILIIAAIAIPNLLRARISANEAAAVSSVRSITTAELIYWANYTARGYAPTLANMGTGGINTPCPNPPTPAAACLLDPLLASGLKQGYAFMAVPGPGGAVIPQMDFSEGAKPLSPSTGVRSFCAREDNVVRVDPTGVQDGTTCTVAFTPI